MQPVLPDRAFPDAPWRADLAACRDLLRGGSRTFHAAAYLLPPRVRDPAIALYAFCRVADDAIDHETGRKPALARLRGRLERAYDGRPLPLPPDRVMAAVAARFGLPRALPEALLEGFAWDAEGRRYETLPDLIAYAVRVAGSVGVMLALIMGVRAAEVLARAADLGVAMQLSNIARDVGEDARAGRLYLPLSWLREAGIDPDAWLAAPVFTPALGAVVQRLLAIADAFYARADPGIDCLPLACRPGIRAARTLYAEIGRAVERQGLDSVFRRAVVPARRKAWLLARSLATPYRKRRDAAAAVLAEARFLIDAAIFAPLPAATAPGASLLVPWRHLEHRAIWVIALFERLARRERLARYEPLGTSEALDETAGG